MKANGFVIEVNSSQTKLNFLNDDNEETPISFTTTTHILSITFLFDLINRNIKHHRHWVLTSYALSIKYLFWCDVITTIYDNVVLMWYHRRKLSKCCFDLNNIYFFHIHFHYIIQIKHKETIHNKCLCR
jgi:hypothetical protein